MIENILKADMRQRYLSSRQNREEGYREAEYGDSMEVMTGSGLHHGAAGGASAGKGGSPYGRLLQAVLAAVIIPLALWLTGCGGGRTPVEWLRECNRAAHEYTLNGGYLRFRQEAENVLRTERGTLTRSLRAEGEMILPDRERYEYREEVRSDIGEEKGGSNSFSYLTLDGGKTAYVKGEKLLEQLGVEGWVHYTPPEDRNRFFDYLKLVDRVTTADREVEWLGLEEAEGVRCAHLAFDLSGRDLLELRSQEDTSLLEGYQDLGPEWLDEILRVEVWIGEESLLPVRVRLGTQYNEQGMGMTYTLLVVFQGYGEQPPFPIEKPAVCVEAK
ncbi:hypothetical protein [Candidatus Solincola sp.]|nr:hypothetical protein [Actinomycetota bacterium]MDI7251746.1 hypothetical protein [Actinomycetota bacterium]